MALESIRLSAESRGLTLEVDIDPSAGRIVGDAERLQQVIWNVLSNSIKLEDRTRALRAGFNAHVAKPVEPNELLAVLGSLATAG